jgi:HSP20 family protein
MTYLAKRKQGLHPLESLFNMDLSDAFNGLPEAYRSTKFPALDIEDDENEVVVRTELPGVEKSDVDVDYHDGVLTISGEKRVERKDANEARSYREISTGSFSRKVSVGDVNFDATSAVLKDGVLTITLPRSESKKPKRLAIN